MAMANPSKPRPGGGCGHEDDRGGDRRHATSCREKQSPEDQVQAAGTEATTKKILSASRMLANKTWAWGSVRLGWFDRRTRPPPLLLLLNLARLSRWRKRSLTAKFRLRRQVKHLTFTLAPLPRLRSSQARPRKDLLRRAGSRFRLPKPFLLICGVAGSLNAQHPQCRNKYLLLVVQRFWSKHLKKQNFIEEKTIIQIRVPKLIELGRVRCLDQLVLRCLESSDDATFIFCFKVGFSFYFIFALKTIL